MIAVGSHTEVRLRAIRLGDTNGKTIFVQHSQLHYKVKSWVEQLACFLSGEPLSLAGISLDFSGLTSFSRKVYVAARNVAWGQCLSYADLAQRIATRSHARAVANALRHNPFPLVVPCHRVVGSHGSPGGFMGAHSGKPVQLKLRLLRNEGIIFS